MKKVFTAAVVVLLLGVAGSGFTDSDLDKAPRMSLEEFKALLEEQSIYVIDVRYPRDYEIGHIPGAELIPLELINSYLPRLREVRQPIVAYCQ